MTAYLSFLVYLLAILGFVALTLWLNRVLGPKPEPTPLKLEPFECGATAIETDNMRAVPVKYYAIAVVFILFDLETVFLYLWALAATPLTGFMLGDVRAVHPAAGADHAVRLAVRAAGRGDDLSATTPVPRQQKSAAFEYLTTRKDEFVGWARKFSLFPYPFVTACCAMEFMSVSSTLYDTDRFGAALPRFTPRQSDLLMVVGTVSHKQAPILRKVYEQMCEPKWVIAFGVCATSGGFYQNYAALPGIDKIIPVDLYIPGCPPRPEMVIDGIMKLQDKIAGERHPIINQDF